MLNNTIEIENVFVILDCDVFSEMKLKKKLPLKNTRTHFRSIRKD